MTNLIENIKERERLIRNTSEELIKLWVEQGQDLVATGRSVRDLASLTKLGKSSIGRYMQIASNPTVLAYLAEGKSLIGYTQRELIGLKPEVVISDAVYGIADKFLATSTEALKSGNTALFDELYTDDMFDGLETKEDSYALFGLVDKFSVSLRAKVMEDYKTEFGEYPNFDAEGKMIMLDPKAELEKKIKAHEAELEAMKLELASV